MGAPFVIVFGHCPCFPHQLQSHQGERSVLLFIKPLSTTSEFMLMKCLLESPLGWELFYRRTNQNSLWGGEGAGVENHQPPVLNQPCLCNKTYKNPKGWDSENFKIGREEHMLGGLTPNSKGTENPVLRTLLDFNLCISSSDILSYILCNKPVI